MEQFLLVAPCNSWLIKGVPGMRFFYHRNIIGIGSCCLLFISILAACNPTAPSLGAISPLKNKILKADNPSTSIYVAIGASDAFGIGTNDPKKQSWPVVLSQLLEKKVHLINLGIPGATLALALRAELPIAKDVKPDIVTVWLGVNDFDQNIPLETYGVQLQQLISLLQQPSAAIYVGNIPDLTYLPRYANANHYLMKQQITEWNVAIRTICQESGVTLVDLFSAWNDLAQHPEYISGDGFHPSEQGANRIAHIFSTVIIEGVTPTITPTTSTTG
jgi:acyl-CoA thioesterase-1